MTRTGAARRAAPLLGLIVASLFVAIAGAACWISVTRPVPVDFLSFWAAGRLAIGGSPEQAYDVAAHLAVQEQVVAVGGLIPFPYPPPFLMLVAPFGIPPFGIGFTLWLLVTGALYVAAARHFVSVRSALAQPAFVANGLIGQAGMLTSAIFLGGLKALESRPALAGAILGTLVIKPQLALMLPVALVASGNWRAIAAALASAASLLLLAALLLGAGSYSAFLDLAGRYPDYLLQGRWPWNEVASLFGTARYFGLDPLWAAALHALVAIAAAVMVWRAWAADRPGKVALLAAATMLASPYILTYDGLFLLLPFAWLVNHHKPWLAVTVWLLALLPVLASFGIYSGPNTLWLAALLSLGPLANPRRPN